MGFGKVFDRPSQRLYCRESSRGQAPPPVRWVCIVGIPLVALVVLELSYETILSFLREEVAPVAHCLGSCLWTASRTFIDHLHSHPNPLFCFTILH